MARDEEMGPDLTDLFRSPAFRMDGPPEDDEQECGECGDERDDVVSTYCGSLCEDCLRAHVETCEVCANDFKDWGL